MFSLSLYILCHFYIKSMKTTKISQLQFLTKLIEFWQKNVKVFKKYIILASEISGFNT